MSWGMDKHACCSSIGDIMGGIGTCIMLVPDEPYVSVDLYCGFPLRKTATWSQPAHFHADVRDSIPDVAEDMRWGKKVVIENNTLDEEIKYLCSSGTGNWWEKYTRTKTNQYKIFTTDHEVLDIFGDCSSTGSAGGLQTRTHQKRNGACFDPPNNTLTKDDNLGGEWDDDAGYIVLTGTNIDGDPISENASISTSGDGDATYTISVAVGKVMQSVSYDWDVTSYNSEDPPEATGTDVGTASHDTGFEDPIFVYDVSFPDHDDIKWMELEWELFFTPDGGVEESVGVLSEIWEEGDEREVKIKSDYPGFGIMRIGNVRYRCNTGGFWIEKDDIPTNKTGG
jgi:hypothetical protein